MRMKDVFVCKKEKNYLLDQICNITIKKKLFKNKNV